MKCALNGTVLLNENCYFANTKTVENKYCIHYLKRCGTKCKTKYLIYEMCLFFFIFRCPQTMSAVEQLVCFERRSTSTGKYQFLLLFLLNVLVPTLFPGPLAVYIVINLLAVQLLRVVKLTGSIGKIMVYFVVAFGNCKLS